jgi:hypothetical protein
VNRDTNTLNYIGASGTDRTTGFQINDNIFGPFSARTTAERSENWTALRVRNSLAIPKPATVMVAPTKYRWLCASHRTRPNTQLAIMRIDRIFAARRV